jgi:hypothetical protein
MRRGFCAILCDDPHARRVDHRWMIYDRPMRMGRIAFGVACAVACGKGEDVRSTPGSASGSGTSSVPASPDAIDIPAGLSPEQRTAAEQAKDALLKACAAAPIDRNEFSEVTLSTSKASGYLKDRFDWELMVTVALVYKEGLDRRRGGHRLTFDMGAGNRPGIVTRKSHGIELCRFTGRAKGVSSHKPCDPNGAEDCILDVPALKALDASRPAAVVVSDRTAPAAWCFGHGFDPPAFWKCAANEKACKNARTAEKREENGEYKVRTECSKTGSLHCFAAESGKIVCAPDAATCTTSRKEWTNSGTATPCEVATAENLEASNRSDE